MAVMYGLVLPSPSQPETVQEGESNLVHVDYSSLLSHLRNVGDRNFDKNLREFLHDTNCRNNVDLDGISCLLGEAIHDRVPSTKELIRSCARILLEIPPSASPVDMMSWSHAATYLFRGLLIEEGRAASLLDEKQDRSLASDIIKSLVERAELSQSLACTPVILRALLIYNLSQLDSADNLTNFPFKPRFISRKQFSRMLHAAAEEVDEVSSGKLRAAPVGVVSEFATAKNAKGFFAWVLNNKVKLPRDSVVLRLFSKLEKEFGQNAVDYVSRFKEVREGGDSVVPNGKSSINGEGVKRVIERLRRNKDVVSHEPGIFFDVFGTLITPDGAPDRRLVHCLQKLHDRALAGTGPRVAIVSDSEFSGGVKGLLQELGLEGSSIPFYRKADLMGRKLGCLVDDKLPEIQGLRANTHIRPGYASDLILRGMETNTLDILAA